MNTDHRPSVDQEEEQRGKRQCMDIYEDDNKENFQVVVGSPAPPDAMSCLSWSCRGLGDP